MKTIEIKEKLIYLDKVHFIRRNSKTELLVSFGQDFLRFTGTSKEIDDIYFRIKRDSDE